jgi:aldose 1-epimerase
MPPHRITTEHSDGTQGLVLTSSDERVRVGFAPRVGMVGYSFVHDGEELLAQRGGLTAYAERGSTFGIPLLHPWANRLDGSTYLAGDRSVDLSADRSPLHLDANGLPIHGLLAGSSYWEVVGREATDERAAVAARLDFGAHEELLAAFPFPHELLLQARLEANVLTVATTVVPTGEAPVPVAFGWHPYLRLPGLPREAWLVEMPVRRRALLDGRGIPTGETEAWSFESGQLGARTFDDLFPELESPTCFVLAGAGRRIELEFGEGYPVAQVFAPPGEQYICFEPMTAPTNALVSGSGLRYVEPPKSFRAVWSLRVSAV